MSEKKILKTAVVGIGNMGSAHAFNVYSGGVKGMILAALCDISESKRKWAAERFDGVPIYSNIEEMINDCDLDAVVIAVPHYAHTQCAVKALEKGINVMVEKPICVSVSQAEKLNGVAEASGKVFGIMFNQRTDPIFKKCRDTVLSGEIGEIKRISWTVTNWYRTDSYYASSPWRATWAGEGGGVLINQAPHNLDMLQWIFGMPSSVRARCVEGKYHDIEVEDFAHIYMEYENGATAEFLTTTGEYPGTNRLEAVGDRGKLVLENGLLKIWKLDFSENEYRHSSQSGSCSEKCEYNEYKFEPIDNAHAKVLEVFAEKILNGGDLVADGYEGIRELELSNAAYLSSWTDKTVYLPIDADEFDRLLDEKKRGSRYDGGLNDGKLPDGKISKRWQIKW